MTVSLPSAVPIEFIDDDTAYLNNGQVVRILSGTVWSYPDGRAAFIGSIPGCTCPPAWWGILPPPCPVHNPSPPGVTVTVDRTTSVRPCFCTGACRVLGYCPANRPQRPPAMRSDEV
jgi:hypothetical protein